MATSKIQTGLRLDEITYAKAKALADQERRSLNNLVEYALQKYIFEFETVNGPISVPEE